MSSPELLTPTRKLDLSGATVSGSGNVGVATGSTNSPTFSARAMPSPDGTLSRIAALEVAEAHVAQMLSMENDKGYPKYSLNANQRTVHVLAYAEWLCGGPPPKAL